MIVDILDRHDPRQFGLRGLTIIAATTQRTLVVAAKIAHLASRHPLEGSASSFEINVSQMPRDKVGISSQMHNDKRF
jgi:hypothetical protein